MFCDFFALLFLSVRFFFLSWIILFLLWEKSVSTSFPQLHVNWWTGLNFKALYLEFLTALWTLYLTLLSHSCCSVLLSDPGTSLVVVVAAASISVVADGVVPTSVCYCCYPHFCGCCWLVLCCRACFVARALLPPLLRKRYSTSLALARASITRYSLSTVNYLSFGLLQPYWSTKFGLNLILVAWVGTSSPQAVVTVVWYFAVLGAAPSGSALDACFYVGSFADKT